MGARMISARGRMRMLCASACVPTPRPASSGPSSPRRSAVLALLRLATLAPDPWEWDEVLFTEGVRDGLDVRVNHPHAPGYPVFVRLGQGIRALGVEPFHATALARRARRSTSRSSRSIFCRRARLDRVWRSSARSSTRSRRPYGCTASGRCPTGRRGRGLLRGGLPRPRDRGEGTPPSSGPQCSRRSRRRPPAGGPRAPARGGGGGDRRLPAPNERGAARPRGRCRRPPLGRDLDLRLPGLRRVRRVEDPARRADDVRDAVRQPEAWRRPAGAVLEALVAGSRRAREARPERSFSSASRAPCSRGRRRGRSSSSSSRSRSSRSASSPSTRRRGTSSRSGRRRARSRRSRWNGSKIRGSAGSAPPRRRSSSSARSRPSVPRRSSRSRRSRARRSPRCRASLRRASPRPTSS